MTKPSQRAYLASPLGFAASTAAYMAELKEALAALLIMENPWDLGGPEVGAAFAAARQLSDYDARRAALHQINQQIGATNAAAIRRCDLVVAVLDGVDVDSGTAAEIGYAAALAKPVFGLRTDSRQTGDNLGSQVNLQVEYWITIHGGCIVSDIPALLAAVRTWQTTHQ